ncbi:MAG: FAD-dependent oxidoreductase [Faecalibacterium prausnitzii]
MNQTNRYDVIVAGGGSAGVAAALGALKAGAKVLLIERGGSLGGQATNANVASYCGFYTRGENARQVVKGIGQEVLEKLKEVGIHTVLKKSSTGNSIITFDEEELKYALDCLTEDYGLEILLHCRVISARKNEAGDRITSICCVDDEQEYWFEADQFVDATGDANLAHQAGAEIRFGDGQGHGYLSTKMMRIDHIDPSVQFKPDILEKVFKQAKADGYQHLTKESGIVFRTHEDTAYAILPSVFVTSMDAATLTACERDTRRQCQDYMKAFRQYLPGMENARLVSTGAQLGLRDTRHIIGDYMITAEDVMDAVKQEDAVACGAWPCEMHNKLTSMLSYQFIKDNDYYSIPLRAITSKNIHNLYAAGRTVSADPVAFASVRVMGTGFATGHAAGVAAACKAKDPNAGYPEICAELLRQNAVL